MASTSRMPTATRPVAPQRPSCANALPNEIVLEIFLFHVALWTSKYNRQASYWQDKYPYIPSAASLHGWMAIAWVCKHWRAVALEAPALWTTIYVTEPLAPLEAYLARSKSKPLTLICRLPKALKNHVSGLPVQPWFRVPEPATPSISAAWGPVLEHAHRVEALFFDCRLLAGITSAVVASDAGHGLGPHNFDFPRLKHLSYRGNAKYAEYVIPFMPGRSPAWTPLICKPHGWSSGEVLDVTCAPFDRVLPLFSGTLLKLSLSGMIWNGSTLAVWRNLLDALSSLNSLQEFRLLDNPPTLTGDFEHDSAIAAHLPLIVLPKLQLLEVSSTDSQGALQAELLISHLSAPPGLSIHITLSSDEISASTYARLCSAIRAELAGAASKTLRTLCVHPAGRTDTATAVGWDDVRAPLVDLPHASARSRSTPWLKLDLPPLSGVATPAGFLARGPPTAALDTLCAHLPLDTLERLALRSWCAPARYAALPAGRFAAWFGRAHALRELSVAGWLVHARVDELAGGAGGAAPLFPRLEVLRLAALRDGNVYRCAGVLAARHRAFPAHRLRKVVLDDVEADDNVVVGLKDVVEELVCIRGDRATGGSRGRVFVNGQESDS